MVENWQNHSSRPFLSRIRHAIFSIQKLSETFSLKKNLAIGFDNRIGRNPWSRQNFARTGKILPEPARKTLRIRPKSGELRVWRNLGAPQARKCWYFDPLKRRFTRGNRYFRTTFSEHVGELRGCRGRSIWRNTPKPSVCPPPLFKKPKWVIGGGTN